MVLDQRGRPLCRLCGRPITRAFRAEHGEAVVFACEMCGAEERVSREQLRRNAA